jgi:hypothetical protein
MRLCFTIEKSEAGVISTPCDEELANATTSSIFTIPYLPLIFLCQNKMYYALKAIHFIFVKCR